MPRTSSSSVDRTSSLELLVRVERGAAPLRAQVEEQLRDAVRSGRLAPGLALPSSRSLAHELGVSRGVVVDAYAQLAAEGYLVSAQGAPTRVSEAAIPAALAVPAPAPTSRRASTSARAAPTCRCSLAEHGSGRCGARYATPGLPARLRRPARRTRAARRRDALPRPRPRRPRRPRARRDHLGHGPGHGALRPRARRPRLAAHRDGGPVQHAGARAADRQRPRGAAGAGRRGRPGIDRLEQLAPAAVFTAPAHQFPLGVVLAPGAPGRADRLGRAYRRLRARGRLRRRVPLRPPAGRRSAGPRARPRPVRRLGQQDARPRGCGSAGWSCPTGSPRRS